MAVQQAVKTGAGVTARALAWQTNLKAACLAEKLEAQRLQEETRRDQQAAEALAKAAQGPGECDQQPIEIVKSFTFHIGGRLHVPTADRKDTHRVDTPQELSSRSSPFSGLPLQAWAERMGDRIMPAYDLIQEERKRAKLAAKKEEPQEFVPPQVPHLLPFTRWAAASKSFQETLIAEDAKSRKKARLSWYHPDDTMVPRGWFSGGLLEDLKYYHPFRKAQPAAQ